MGSHILDVIHNPHFDNDNSDFIKAYILLLGEPTVDPIPPLATLFMIE